MSDSWYRNAVFYELYLRAFQDGDGNGHGDFRGLRQRLDYLQWLGVDCIWLLPVNPSPLRDDGYDVASFYGIHADFGLLEDFQLTVEEIPPARHARHHGPGAEPHIGRAPPGFRKRAPRASRPCAIGMSGAMTTGAMATRASSSWIRSNPTGHGTKAAASITGIASIPASRTSTTRIRPCARR